MKPLDNFQIQANGAFKIALNLDITGLPLEGVLDEAVSIECDEWYHLVTYLVLIQINIARYIGCHL